MSSAIPKGEMSAFQRWEMASFGDDRPSQVTDQLVRATEVTKTNQLNLDNAKEAARREGNALGYQDGYAAGLMKGHNVGKEKMEVEIAHFHGLTEQFSEQLAAANLAIGSDVFKLAVDLAQAMTRSKLECDPEIIIPLIRDAIAALPSVPQPAQINVNPEDALIIADTMRDELNVAGWRIVSDPHIERGGCTLETAQNLIDATFTTRWNRLTDALKIGLAASGST